MSHPFIIRTENRSPDDDSFHTIACLQPVAWFTASIKYLMLIFLPAVLFFSTVSAQTLPPASSCTSGDLLLVAATLPPNPGEDACGTCTAGANITRTLYLSINNKTGSTRTSFAYWGTLEIYNADGTLFSSTPKTDCRGPIIKNSVNTVNFGTITYKCGQSLKLTNLYLAWTSASPGETCPLNPALINPKCGTLPSIQIVAGLDANIAVTDATCTSSGSLAVSPFGGKAPYTVTVGGVTRTGIAAGATTTFTNLAPANYTITITDATTPTACTATKTRTVNAPSSIPTPVATVTQPTCATATATVTITSPVAGVTYTLKQGGVTKYTADGSGVFSSVVAGTYALNASNGTCSAAGNDVTVDPQPATPDAPSASVTQPTCAIAKGTITITAPLGAGITYSINGTGYQAGTTFSDVDPGTYNVTAKANGCTSGPVSKTVNPQPATPDAPSASVTQPTCAIAKGTITITAPLGAGITYSINGTDYQAGTSFSDVDPGTYNVTAKANGCTSGSVSKTVNPQPATPDAPSAGVTQPTCTIAKGTITITAPLGAGITYSINGTDYQAGTTFSDVDPGTYNITAKANGCTSGTVSKTVNPQPATPGAPSVCIVQPSLCGSAGSVTINNAGGDGFEYSIDNGTSWNTNNVFSNLGAGSVSGIKIKSPAGCISPTADCDVSDCSQTAGRSVTTSSTQNKSGTSLNTLADLKISQPTVKAFPNPFGKKVKFVVTIPEAGTGSLELVNLLGQKVKTVFQGRMPAGANTFEVNLPYMQMSQLIYILRMSDKQVTGKLLQLNQ